MEALNTDRACIGATQPPCGKRGTRTSQKLGAVEPKPLGHPTFMTWCNFFDFRTKLSVDYQENV